MQLPKRKDLLARSYWCAGLLLDFLAETADTGGAFTLIDSQVRQGTEPPPHTHTHEDESLLLLQGELQVWVGDEFHILHPGDYILMPRGVEHYFRAVTPQVRLMVQLSPGGLEQGFKVFGVPVSESLAPPPREQVPDFPEIARIFAELGVRFTPR
jgi:quercetin dioxygenase-like cupin family protein